MRIISDIIVFAMANYVYHTEFAVRDYEIDSEGIVNNAIYLHYLEHSRHNFCREAGFSFAQMKEQGMIPVVNRIEVDYKTPLRSGDVVDSRLWVEMRGPRFVFHQDLYNRDTGNLAVSAVVSVVCLVDGKPSRGEMLAQIFARYLP